MIDKNFRPWLLEVNQSPSFATDSPLDYEVKKNVLRDTFNLLNISAERREEAIKLK
jgi:tubulin polyglutamylase TTLL6/13